MGLGMVLQERSLIDTLTDDRNVLNENNMLVKLSDACNGNEQCYIDFKFLSVEGNPLPQCTKMLEVEYRCFEFDRPWIERSSGPEMTIDCLKESKDLLPQ